MKKQQFIDRINTQFNGNLNTWNTSYSGINKAKAVWWFNINVSKFEDDVHLLLADTDHVLWITLPKGFVSNLQGIFKIREDKNAVDVEISADKNFGYLVDVKSGGTGFVFRKYVKEVIVY
jgi:hypothetical protein